MSLEDSRNESVTVARRQYLGKGLRQRQENGETLAARWPSRLQLRGFLNVSSCFIALQCALPSGAWIPWLWTFEKLCTHKTGQQEVPLLNYKRTTSCLLKIIHLLLAFHATFSFRYTITLKHTDPLHCFYSGSPYHLLWCGSLYLALRNYAGSPLNNHCRRLIQLPGHVFSPFIPFSDGFSFIARAATARWDLLTRGQYCIDFDKDFPNF